MYNLESRFPFWKKGLLKDELKNGKCKSLNSVL